MNGAAPVGTLLVPFGSEHLPLLATWLARPHVARWFGPQHDHLAFAAYPPEGGAHALITNNGNAVGYVRWRRLSRVALDAAGFLDLPDGCVDLDLFLGEASSLSRGIGTATLTEVLATLRTNDNVPLVAAIASIDNLRARRAFEKVGFSLSRECAPPGCGPCWLLLFSK